MPDIVYVYFDDTPSAASSVKDNLELTNRLIIDVKREEPWKDIISYLVDNQTDYNGIILDWRLDSEPDSDADFSTEALAQQCRRLVSQNLNTKKFTKDFPMILCSSQPDFASLHEKDTTSTDLFDVICTKNELEDKGSFLIALVEAYTKLNLEDRNACDILGLTSSKAALISQELIRKLDSIKNQNPHEIISFLQKEVLDKKGALINEDILSARLGVNKNSEGWSNLLEKISDAKYIGLLSCIDRWWGTLIDEWWEVNFEADNLKYLAASERILFLEAKYTELVGKLNKLELCEGSMNEEFWTVCYGSGAALSELDGFAIDQHLHYSWQEREYVCLNTAKNEDNIDKWKALISYENDRLEQYFEEE